MGPTKVVSFVVASLRIYLILGQFKKNGPVHFEALDPSETTICMHGNYQVICQNNKRSDRLHLTKFLLCNFINKKVMQIFDVSCLRF